MGSKDGIVLVKIRFVDKVALLVQSERVARHRSRVLRQLVERAVARRSHVGRAVLQLLGQVVRSWGRVAPVVVTTERILALKDLADAAGLVRRVARLDRLLLNLSALDSSELDTRGDKVDVLDKVLGNVVSVKC